MRDYFKSHEVSGTDCGWIFKSQLGLNFSRHPFLSWMFMLFVMTNGQQREVEIEVGGSNSDLRFFKASVSPQEIIIETCIIDTQKQTKVKKHDVEQALLPALTASGSLAALQALRNNDEKLFITFANFNLYMDSFPGAYGAYYAERNQILLSTNMPLDQKTLTYTLANELEHFKVSTIKRAFYALKTLPLDIQGLKKPFTDLQQRQELENAIFKGLTALWQSKTLHPLFSNELGINSLSIILGYKIPPIAKLLKKLPEKLKDNPTNLKLWNVMLEAAEEAKGIKLYSDYYKTRSTEIQLIECDSDIASLQSLLPSKVAKKLFAAWHRYHNDLLQTYLPLATSSIEITEMTTPSTKKT